MHFKFHYFQVSFCNIFNLRNSFIAICCGDICSAINGSKFLLLYKLYNDTDFLMFLLNCIY